MTIRQTLDTIVEKTKHSYLAKAIPLTVGFGLLAAGAVTGYYNEALNTLAPFMTAAATTMNDVAPDPVSLQSIASCAPLALDMLKQEATHLYNSYNFWLPVATAASSMYGAATAYVWHNWKNISERAVGFYHSTVEPAARALKTYFVENKEYAIKGALIGAAIFGGLAILAVNKDIDSAIDFVKNYDKVQIIGQYLSHVDSMPWTCLGDVIQATPVDKVAVAALEHAKSYPGEIVKATLGGGMLGGFTGAGWGSSREYYLPKIKAFGAELKRDLKEALPFLYK